MHRTSSNTDISVVWNNDQLSFRARSPIVDYQFSIINSVMKYLFIPLLFIALWFSFYTEPLSQRQAREAMKQYNPEQLVEYHWQNSLASLADQALPIEQFLQQLQADPEALRQQSGHLLGIGSNVYYVISGDASGVTFSDHEFRFQLQGIDCHIPTKYIFGNVAREATGWFDLGEFQNTMDFNSVSATINQRIRDQVIAPLLTDSTTLTSCHFCAAIEVQPGQRQVNALTLYPYILQAQ